MTNDFNLRQSTLTFILGCLLLAVIPHVTHIPVWPIVFCCGLIIWRWLIGQRHWKLPNTFFRLVIACIIFAVVVFKNQTFGRDSGITLLIMMLGLKLMEMNSLRDAMVVLFLSYFLVVTHFLYSQEIVIAVYMMGLVVLTTMTMIDLNNLSGKSWRWQVNFRLSLKLLLQALPLMVFLFLLFPRLSGPLWGLPSDGSSGVTGLSNEMSPGSVSKLSQSDAVAFRVNFKGKIPEPDQRYWRGPIFWQTDGIRWHADRLYGRRAPESMRKSSKYTYWRYAGFNASNAPDNEAEYTVTLEPHQQKWLFALDVPYAAPHDAIITSDLQLLSNTKVDKRKRYNVISYLDYTTGELTDTEEYRATELPPLSQRVFDLAQSWRQAAANDHEVIQSALQYFRKNPFVYTLNPPLLGKQPTDEFLFETRAGFCEHYAAAFTLLMRAAQIPSRVVTGYLGGKINPLGNYLIVHQADAHAWSEVWLPEQGWVRVDPTSAVLPERINVGLQESLRRLAEGDTNIARQTTTQLLSGLVNNLKNAWDALNNAWYESVLGFGPELQQDFWAKLGLENISWQTLGMLLGGVLVVWLMLVSGQLFWQGYQIEAPVTKYYRKFCHKLAKIGLKRKMDEGPLMFAERVIKSRPDLAGKVKLITQLYVEIRYKQKSVGNWEEKLRYHVKQFKPRAM